MIFKFLQGGGLNLLKNLNKLMGLLKENCISWHPRENHTHNFRDSWAPWSLVMDCFRRCQVNNLCHSQIIQCVIIYSGNTGMYSATQQCDYVRATENPDISKLVHLLHQLVISMLLFLKSCFILLCNLLSGVEQEKTSKRERFCSSSITFILKKKKKRGQGAVCMYGYQLW